MRELGKEIKIPLDKGHYAGFYDSASTMLENNLIPLGYYYATDIVIDDCGFLRARPMIKHWITAQTNTAVLAACFKLNNNYYIIPYSGSIMKWGGSSFSALSGSPTFSTTDIVNIDFVSVPASSNTQAMVSRKGSNKILFVSGDTVTTATPTDANGIASQDEGRGFCVSNNMVYYSVRYDVTQGYDYNNLGGYLTIPEVCDEIVALKNVAGSLYLIQSSANSGRTYIWKKVQSFSDSETELDFTSFTQVLGIDDANINNGNDAIAALGGNIIFWACGSGLNIVGERGTNVVSQAVQSWNPLNLHYDCVVAVDQRSKYIFVRDVGVGGATTTYAYSMVNGTWSKWNFALACKGYGQAGGMFGIKGYISPCYVGSYPTDTSDTSIAPVLYTPVIDFGKPDYEKFLRAIHCSGRGITQIDVYTRLTPGNTFSLLHTISSPELITKLEGDSRFGECYIKITGNQLFQLKELKLVYDTGDTIFS